MIMMPTHLDLDARCLGELLRAGGRLILADAIVRAAEDEPDYGDR